MRNNLLLTVLFALVGVVVMADLPDRVKEDGWIPLFDGKTLDGWKANENPATFSVADGAIMVILYVPGGTPSTAQSDDPVDERIVCPVASSTTYA